jgi:hypothetical protein
MRGAVPGSEFRHRGDLDTVNARVHPKRDLAQNGLKDAGIDLRPVTRRIDRDRTHAREGSHPVRAGQRRHIVGRASLAQGHDVVQAQVLQPPKGGEGAAAYPSPELAVLSVGRVNHEGGSLDERILRRLRGEPAQREILLQHRPPHQPGGVRQPPAQPAPDTLFLGAAEPAQEPRDRQPVLAAEQPAPQPGPEPLRSVDAFRGVVAVGDRDRHGQPGNAPIGSVGQALATPARRDQRPQPQRPVVDRDLPLDVATAADHATRAAAADHAAAASVVREHVDQRQDPAGRMLERPLYLSRRLHQHAGPHGFLKKIMSDYDCAVHACAYKVDYFGGVTTQFSREELFVLVRRPALAGDTPNVPLQVRRNQPP